MHVRGSVPNDTSLYAAQAQVLEAVQMAVKAILDGTVN
jgi:hypothetical protein